MGLCMVISVLLPSVEVGPTAQCLPAHPIVGGKVAWQLLWWLSDINKFGHFCGRRGSSCRWKQFLNRHDFFSSGLSLQFQVKPIILFQSDWMPC